MIVSVLQVSDIERFLDFEEQQNPESGRDGQPHFHVYSAKQPLDRASAAKTALKRWSTPLDQRGWRRTWGLFDDSRVVGTLQLTGSDLDSSSHRVDLGMGLLKTHRQQGWGSKLLDTALHWARLQEGIDWIDLGVFEDNPGAKRLYEKFGFVVQGTVPDQFRVDGISITNIAMSLWVTKAP